MSDPSDANINAPVFEKLDPVFSRRNASNCCGYLLPHIKPDSHILDVGCGTGFLTLSLARLVPQGRIIGIDIHEPALVQARHLAAQHNITNVEFRHCDAQDLTTFADGAFDVAHAHMAMMHLPRPVDALREMRRVVKPGSGLVAIRDLAAVALVAAAPAMQRAYTLFQQMAREAGAEPEGGRFSHVWAHEAGFAWEKMEMSSAGWEFSGPEGRRVFAESVKLSLRGLAIKLGRATASEMDEVAREWEEWERKDDARFMGLDGQVLCWK
ncbi:putative ubiE/COQ5 methyltransferase [Glonium stellatum]|uniref:Putative ubiE/COQ5 methyltransferase n=1 Tax=Glonium stellatum TaxID=574774 RepID=A0A8E2JQQ8_9PEZI|nr:putative ubiE/COQ5 methyltransferase [Glonium stellatum]